MEDDKSNEEPHTKIEKPEDTVYKHIVLSNDMKVCLISDPEITKACCALVLNVGSLCDPGNFPGLAQLCEKMLTMGSQMYPKYNDFDNYLFLNEGFHCTVTYPDNTQYYFDIDPKYFHTALKQYIQYFLTPLFDSQYILEQMKDLRDHHNLKLADTSYILEIFVKSIMTTKHPYKKLAFRNQIGNMETSTVKRMLFDFFYSYYSANLMTLCVISNESLDKLEDMIQELFCAIPNKRTEVSLWYDHPFKDEFCTTWYIVPQKEIKELYIIFPLPEEHEYYWLQAADFIITLLRLNSEGSFMAYLEDINWGSNYSITRHQYARGINFLTIKFDLNEKDVLRINIIIELLFEYIYILKKDCHLTSSLSQLRQLYEKFISQDMSSKNKNAEDKNVEQKEWDLSVEIVNIAQKLHTYPVEEIIYSKNKTNRTLSSWKFVQSTVKNILNNFIIPEKIRIYVFAKENDAKGMRIAQEISLTDRIDRYKEEKISQKLIQNWKTIYLPHFRFHLPPVDKFYDCCNENETFILDS